MKHTKFHLQPLWQMLRLGGQFPLLAGMTVIAILRTVRDMGCMVTLAHAADSLIYGGSFAASLFFMIVAMFAGSPIYALDRYLAERFRVQLRYSLTRTLSHHLEHADLAWFLHQSSGSLLSICTADLEKFIRWASAAIPEFIRLTTYALAAIAYCMTQSITLTLCIVPVIIISVPVISLISRPLKTISDGQRNAAGVSLQKTQEAFGDLESVKSYGLESFMERRVNQALQERRKAEEAGAKLKGIVEALSYFSSYLPGFIAAGAGTFFLLRGEITTGFLITFVQLSIQRLSELVPKIGTIAVNTQQTSASAQLLLSLFHAPTAPTGSVECIQGERILELKHVNFSYEPGHPILKGVSLHADRGEMVALVGASGCGKSTILKLLMGIYPHYEGQVLFGGSQVREWNRTKLQEQISPVFQQPFLFPMTIAENLWGRKEPLDENAVGQAIHQAGLSDFVKTLPQGIHTSLSEQGSSLSGGQRQRMTLARAFLKDAPVLLLDEPTSALDTVTENNFQQALNQLRRGRTTLVVAHRLSTIQQADRIYVLENGSVVQCGTHSQLIHSPGPYRTLYESQSKQEAVS